MTKSLFISPELIKHPHLWADWFGLKLTQKISTITIIRVDNEVFKGWLISHFLRIEFNSDFMNIFRFCCTFFYFLTEKHITVSKSLKKQRLWQYKYLKVSPENIFRQAIDKKQFFLVTSQGFFDFYAKLCLSGWKVNSIFPLLQPILDINLRSKCRAVLASSRIH